MKKYTVITTLTCFTLFLTGCFLPSLPDMTEEQEEAITEYSADLLKKYDASYSNGVYTEEQLEKAAQKEEEQKAKDEKAKQLADEYMEKAKTAAAQKEKKSEEPSEGTDSEPKEKKNGPVSLANDEVAEFMNISDFDVEYMGYDIMKSYPDDGNNSVFSVDATEGKQLVVLYLDVTNSGAADAAVDMFTDKNTYSLNCGGTTVESSSKLVLNDFSIYRDTVQAGATNETVLVFETDEGMDISGATLMIKNGDKVGEINL